MRIMVTVYIELEDRKNKINMDILKHELRTMGNFRTYNKKINHYELDFYREFEMHEVHDVLKIVSTARKVYK